MDKILTYEEYIQIANNCGTYDEFDIQLAYRLYKATAVNDEVEMAKADNSIYWNNFFRVLGRPNYYDSK